MTNSKCIIDRRRHGQIEYSDRGYDMQPNSFKYCLFQLIFERLKMNQTHVKHFIFPFKNPGTKLMKLQVSILNPAQSVSTILSMYF